MSDPSDNRLTIDAHGRPSVDDAARARLAPLAGQYRLLPSTSDTLVFERVTTDGRAPAARVTLCGRVDQQGGLADVINFIHSNLWCGQLAVMTPDGARRTIHLWKGDVRAAASTDPNDRLGAILYKYGVISEQALAEALTVGGAPRLGQTLIQRGALSPHDLYTYIRKQIEQIFTSLLTVERAEFMFYRANADEAPPSQIQMSTQNLLFDGLRRMDELSFFRQKLPSDDVVLARTAKAAKDLPATAQTVYDTIDGTRDLATVARLTHLGDFETMKIVHQFMQSGLVQARAPAAPAAAPGGGMHEAYGKVIDVFNEFYAKVFDAVARRGHRDRLVSGLASFFDSTTDFAALFVDVTPKADGTLEKEQLLVNLQVADTDNRLDYLQRGLNELLFFELFTAGESVDQKEEIALHQRLSEILSQLPRDSD